MIKTSHRAMATGSAAFHTNLTVSYTSLNWAGSRATLSSSASVRIFRLAVNVSEFLLDGSRTELGYSFCKVV
ncbi:hypothetical protein EIP91_010641 [Steccherinum ochraceum]|uniref:Uncharacterized protein n=1 Tax=Steccherinum ochraceum TaxID=92696 RepID=A0A4R0R5M6_9APHY|nr:hypothetical protein EIP91_010641 [Steccherinum ochraceum]